MDTSCQVGVMHRELALGAQEQVGKLVGCIFAVRGLTADGDCLPVSIALVEGTARGGHVQVDELGHANPHALQVLHSLLVGKDTGFLVGLEVRIQVLIHAAVGDDGAGLLLEAAEHLDEPLRLDCIAEVLGRELRDTAATRCDLFHLLLTSRIGALGGLGLVQICVAVCPKDDSVAGHDDGLVEGLLVHVIQRIERIKSVKLLLSLGLDARETALQELLVVDNPLVRGAERSGLVDDVAGSGLLGGLVGDLQSIFRQRVVQIVEEGLAGAVPAVPVRGDVV